MGLFGKKKKIVSSVDAAGNISKVKREKVASTPGGKNFYIQTEILPKRKSAKAISASGKTRGGKSKVGFGKKVVSKSGADCFNVGSGCGPGK